MKTIFAVLALLAVTTTAYAEAGRPIRDGLRCWAVTDADRGFGYWDQCADKVLDERTGRMVPPTFSRAASQADLPSGGDGGGDGGGR